MCSVSLNEPDVHECDTCACHRCGWTNSLWSGLFRSQLPSALSSISFRIGSTLEKTYASIHLASNLFRGSSIKASLRHFSISKTDTDTCRVLVWEFYFFTEPPDISAVHLCRAIRHNRFSLLWSGLINNFAAVDRLPRSSILRTSVPFRTASQPWNFKDCPSVKLHKS